MSDTLLKNNGSSLVEKETTRTVSAPATKTERRLTFTPPVDILELPNELVLVLDMPGVKPDNVQIDFERGELAVRGRREALALPGGAAGSRATALVEEFPAVGDYYRAFLISQDVAADKITAELKHGVLTIHLPKAEAAQPRRITVKGN